jgi:4-amino-4-deoxy-L-arabinose transferase-like glycosyltransferase
VQNLRNSQLVLIALTIAALAPFLTKAFHVDDPLFLWIAQQIAKHPLDPYGLDVNWSSFTRPMAEEMQNPPLCSYCIAAVASMFGWNELALHVSFLIWPVLSILGTFALARRFCREPFLAALLTLFTPVFLVSTTNIMSDVTLLAFWAWAIEFWLRGLERQSAWRFFVSALLISAALLTKYFGIALVPLLGVYTVARERRLSFKLLYLLVPIAVVSNYDFATAEKYGRGLFSAALGASSSISFATRPSQLAQLLMGLAFAGGCLFTVIFFVPIWRRRILLPAAIGFIALAAAVKFLILSWVYLDAPEAPVWIEGGLFATLATGILWLAVIHVVREKNPDALLLGLWIIGTFCFATFLNWSITARTFLPMAPAAAILTVRQLTNTHPRFWPTVWRLAACAGLSILIAAADYCQANSARTAAEFFNQRYRVEPNKVRFLGHWGFQYYMQRWGAKPFDRNDPKIANGRIVVGPFNDTNFAHIVIGDISKREEFSFNSLPLVSVSALGCGANFYSSFGGPLPWVVNRIPPERYFVIETR